MEEGGEEEEEEEAEVEKEEEEEEDRGLLKEEDKLTLYPRGKVPWYGAPAASHPHSSHSDWRGPILIDLLVPRMSITP